MKKQLLFLVGVLFAFAVNAQTNYQISYTANAGNPGALNTDNDDVTAGWTTIINASITTNQWSTSVILPFNFTYFGNNVTEFKASANGLVTFNALTTTLPNNNDNLPTATLPDSTIACFWDAFTSAAPTGSNDYVVYKTWGAAPNRQLWIKWVSFEMGAPSVSAVTFACVLEETTNKIYMVECFAGGTPLQTLTTGLQLTSTRAVQDGTKNKPQTVNTGTSSPTDNDYYTFTPYVQSTMTYVSSDLSQPILSNIAKNNTNEGILRIQINTENELSPMTITQIVASTGNTSNFGDIANARIFYTGKDSAFSMGIPFGSSLTPTSSSLIFNGSQVLAPGSNYFWLTYSVSGTATVGNILDAECSQLLINSTTYVPLTISPIGQRIVTNGLSGTYTVGLGGDYSNLSSAFADINLNRLSGHVTLSIVSDIDDPANCNLTYTSSNPYKITIRPSADVLRNITGSFLNSFIEFNGASNVLIDGRGLTSGSGKYLRFCNKDIGPTFSFINGAQLDTFTNLIIEGVSVSQTQGLINFGSSVGYANGIQKIVIKNSDIRNRSDSALGVPTILIYSSATKETSNNAISITNNNLFNFRRSGVYVNTVGNGGNWNISGNHFYYNASNVAAIGDVVPIMFIPGSTAENNEISNNFIGGQAPFCGGSTWVTTNTVNWVAMNINSGIEVGTSVQGNTIQNINLNTTGTYDFVGIRIESGRVVAGNIIGNLIGDPNTPNSIRNSARLTLCIYGFTSTLGEVIIANNTIANVAGLGTTTTAGVRGICLQGGAAVPNIYNNTIFNLSSTATNANALTTTVMGIGLNSGSEAAPVIIRNNKIYNIAALATSANTVPTGLLIDNNSVNGLIEGNMISNITNISTGATASITGIQIGGGVINWIFRNNTIAITNGANTNPVTIRGISDGAAGNNFKFLNNTIYVGGTATTGALNSSAYERRNTSTLVLRNNIFYNERIGGTGIHAALSQTSATTNWTSNSSNYNLLVARSSSAINSWGTTPAAYSFGGWQTTSLGNDLNSWSDTTLNIPAMLFFKDLANGNLMIDTANAFSWYANGKGIALVEVNTDMQNASRSTSVLTGGTDIGADEFSTLTLPPFAKVTGNINYLDSSMFTFAGRTIGKVIWNNGSLPGDISLRYYTGQNPPAVINGKNYFNGYHQFSVSGGSGLIMDVQIYSDPALLGSVPSINATAMANYTNNIWNYDQLSFSESATFSVKSFGVNQLDIFTGTDLAAPLPVQLTSIAAKKQHNDAIVTWTTASEKNSNYFELYYSLDGKNFESISTQKAAGNSSSARKYTYKHAAILSLTNKVYYRLKSVDFDGTFTWSDIVSVDANRALSSETSIYPNPFTSSLTLKHHANTSVTIELVTMQGVSVLVTQVNTNQNGTAVIEGLNNLANGVYFAKITVNGETSVTKLIKQ